MHSWAVTTTLPAFLSLSIQLGPTTLHPRRCTSIILCDDGPQLHLGSPRCDDHHQWWRHTWSRRYSRILNMDYSLYKHLYSLNSVPMNYCRTIWNTCLQTLIMYVPCDYKNLWTINAWTLQECYADVLLEHYVKEISNGFSMKSYLKELGYIKQKLQLNTLGTLWTFLCQTFLSQKLPLEDISHLTIASDEHYKNTLDMFYWNTNVSNVYQSRLHILIHYGITPAFIYNRMSYQINGNSACQ